MADAADGRSVGGNNNNLRERPSAKPLRLNNSDEARQTVIDLNEQEAKEQKHGTKRTYGRTPDGTGTLIQPQHGVRELGSSWMKH